MPEDHVSRTPSQIGRGSIQKGKRMERRIAAELGDWLQCEAKRTPGSGAFGTTAWRQHCGDIMTDVDWGLVVECKHVEGWHLEQLFADGGPRGLIWRYWLEACAAADHVGLAPLLIFTKNHAPTFAALRAHTTQLRIVGDFARFAGVTSPESPYWMDLVLWDDLRSINPDWLWGSRE